ncbi:glutathione peroxidase [Azoarcus sp. TTM-91]|uniref:glutathione peroxidase n=1 Tax=Azoarcus sp. TTM-91 TaxID=2691581 RepID=UPI00145E0289|nr:glutathione peroxidase [Azoarcus sp. TTM-91]NMG35187.1 glutathione peroxidase [Azoarcus sp. TTM-91]
MSEPTVFDFETRSLEGAPMPLAAFRGQVLLVVNTASECGFTPQYQGLQAIHERYREKGFSVIGFPCNQFGGQEPGDAEAIGAFCERNYGVTFPLSEKVEVKGTGAHPLFVHLTKTAPGVLGTEAIKWNFTKFLVDREGRVVDRYAPMTKPESLAGDIEKLL